MKKRQVPVGDRSGRFDPFRPLGREARDRYLDAYRSYLEVRNGAIDLEGRRLSRRESYLKALRGDPVVAEEICDRQGFLDHMTGDGSVPIDEATAWFVAVAKANEGEAYGVDLELRRFDRDERFMRDQRAILDSADDGDTLQLYVFLEELYHSRILCEVGSVCGFELSVRSPRWRIRTLSRAIYHMPDRLRWIVILCAEVVGATAFKLFLDRCELFAHRPEVEARLRSLMSEIWRDELLHVAMLRARLGPLAIRIARRLFPLVVGSLVRDVPELLALGEPPGEFLRRAGAAMEIPGDLDWLEADPV